MIQKRILFCLFFACILLQSRAQDVKPLGIALENFDYPFAVHYINLENQGERLKMAYMDLQPQQANGKTVMLLHGKNFSGAYWEQTAKYLSAQGFRVIMPDQIGFGKSSKPHDLQYTFQLLAQNTRALLYFMAHRFVRGQKSGS